MRRLATVTAALAAMLGSAGIAHSDIADWTGPYLGIGLSSTYAQELMTRLQASVNGNPAQAGGANDHSGALILGYWVPRGNWLLGGELQILGGSPLDFGPSGTCIGTPGDPPCAEAGMIGQLDPTARLLALAGTEATPDTLVFGGLGLVQAEGTFLGTFAIANSLISSAGISSTTAPQTRELLGLSLAAGAEHRLTPAMSLRFSVIYDTFEHWETPSVGSGAGASDEVSSATANAIAFNGIDLTAFTLQLGLMLRF